MNFDEKKIKQRIHSYYDNINFNEKDISKIKHDLRKHQQKKQFKNKKYILNSRNIFSHVAAVTIFFILIMYCLSIEEKGLVSEEKNDLRNSTLKSNNQETNTAVTSSKDTLNSIPKTSDNDVNKRINMIQNYKKVDEEIEMPIVLPHFEEIPERLRTNIIDIKQITAEFIETSYYGKEPNFISIQQAKIKSGNIFTNDNEKYTVVTIEGVEAKYNIDNLHQSRIIVLEHKGLNFRINTYSVTEEELFEIANSMIKQMN